MTTSLISRPVTIVDVPEAYQFRADFVYNFFERDELVNDNPTAPNSILKQAPTADLAFISNINNNKRIARYIKFGFYPVQTKPVGTNIATLNKLSIPLVLASSNVTGFKIGENIDKIVTEEEFTSYNFTGIQFQDTLIDGKLYYLASGSITSRINGILDDPNAGNVKFKIDPTGMQFSQAISYLNSTTSDSITGDLIAQSLNQPAAKNVMYIDKLKNEIVSDTFNDIKGITTRVLFNNKHIAKLVKHSILESSTTYFDELVSILPKATTIETQAKQSANANAVSMDEYNTTLKYVAIRPLESNKPSIVTARVIGYIIDKYEITGNRKVPYIARPPIVIENANASNAVDLNVKYGAVYSYSIRAITAVEFPAVMESVNNKLYMVTVLVSSQPSPRKIITCIERVPPPPPADFTVSWDFTAMKPRLTWALPITSQRDVKKIQVFKRKTIAEPYSLIAMFDFNDANPAVPDTESPSPELVAKSDQPVLLYIDRGFKLGDTAIYTVVAVDAHGFTSDYSVQYEISFDRFGNKIVKKAISRSGAPKPYPNLFLRQDLFIDSIKNSNHRKIKVVFDPEALQLLDSSTGKVNVLTTENVGGKYRLQLINTDYQLQQEVDIVLNDKRTKT